MIDQHTSEVPVSSVSFYMDWSYPTLMRWLKRYRNGEEVCKKPGYEQMAYDPAFVKGRVDLMDHKKKRTKGTGELESEQIATRRTVRRLVKETRDELNKKKEDQYSQVSWSKSGSVWAIDDTLIRYDQDKQKRHLTNIQDLASRYKFNYVTKNNPKAEDIAETLKRLFDSYGAPLFLKRDNGSNLCGKEVNDLLKEYMVIPVNSPVKSPTYNGAIERSQAEIKSELEDDYRYDVSSEMLDLHIENVCHLLNHKARKSLKGKHACQCFSERQKYLKRQRKEVYDKVVFYSKEILKEMEKEDADKSKRRKPWRRNITAIRQASKQVMLEERIIKIRLLSTGEEDLLPL